MFPKNNWRTKSPLAPLGCGRVELAVARLTRHFLRHLFARRSGESGIDIPTLARWLGHSDGGMLALKIYGHLRREHSQSMAAKVAFGTNNALSNT
jgi:site-specific recombinase XerD